MQTGDKPGKKISNKILAMHVWTLTFLPNFTGSFIAYMPSNSVRMFVDGIGDFWLFFVVEYAEFFFAFRVVEDFVSLEFVLLGLLDYAVVFFCV